VHRGDRQGPSDRDPERGVRIRAAVRCAVARRFPPLRRNGDCACCRSTITCASGTDWRAHFGCPQQPASLITVISVGYTRLFV
jgi:hypothetical protein